MSERPTNGPEPGRDGSTPSMATDRETQGTSRKGLRGVAWVAGGVLALVAVGMLALGYFSYRAISLAVGLVDNTTFNGQTARAFAESVAEEEKIALMEGDWGTIIQELMKADFGARTDIFNSNGGQSVDVALPVNTIQTYHEQVYNDYGNGLSIMAWTPYVPLKYASDQAALWQSIVSSSDTLISQLWNGTLVSLPMMNPLLFAWRILTETSSGVN